MAIAGLYVPPPSPPRFQPDRAPAFRTPMPDLNQLGSPYLAGILDAADERMMLLETTRGCVFKCKFCYYPKSYDKQYYLAQGTGPGRPAARRRARRPRGLPARPDAEPAQGLRRLPAARWRRATPAGGFTYFGELRGEGITEETARLLREANFTEVEVGLQSIEPER